MRSWQIELHLLSKEKTYLIRFVYFLPLIQSRSRVNETSHTADMGREAGYTLGCPSANTETHTTIHIYGPFRITRTNLTPLTACVDESDALTGLLQQFPQS